MVLFGRAVSTSHCIINSSSSSSGANITSRRCVSRVLSGGVDVVGGCGCAGTAAVTATATIRGAFLLATLSFIGNSIRSGSGSAAFVFPPTATTTAAATRLPDPQPAQHADNSKRRTGNQKQQSRQMSSSSHTTLHESGGTIVIAPTDEALQTATVIICHGLGDSSSGFADVAELLAKQLPHVKFILPTAPTQPVTMNMGMAMPSWYDIVGLDERSNENCKGINQSRDTIQAILHTEHERGIPYNRMVLAGFSQGGALSLYTGLQMNPKPQQQQQQLAGILVLSGYLAGGKSFKLTPGLEHTPVLHCHGTLDPIVQYTMATKSRDMLLSMGIQEYSLKSYPIQHTVTPQEIADALTFLQRVIPPQNDVCYITVKDPIDMSVKELKDAIRRAGLGKQARGMMEKPEFVKLLQSHRNNKFKE